MTRTVFDLEPISPNFHFTTTDGTRRGNISITAKSMCNISLYKESTLYSKLSNPKSIIANLLAHLHLKKMCNHILNKTIF